MRTDNVKILNVFAVERNIGEVALGCFEEFNTALYTLFFNKGVVEILTSCGQTLFTKGVDDDFFTDRANDIVEVTTT